MAPGIIKLIGPRLSWHDVIRPRYVLPASLLAVAACMLIASFFMPYWKMTLHAPQYPKGLHVVAYLNRLDGDVREIDNLNHYIGMRPLNEAAQLERETSWMSIGAISLLLLAALFIHNRWAAALALPAVLFPAGFLLDLHYWMNNFGQNLDPAAPLSTSIKPFTPPVLGEGFVGQFKTVASAGSGLWLAASASIVVVAALWWHRRAFKPLVDASRAIECEAAKPTIAQPRQKAMAA